MDRVVQERVIHIRGGRRDRNRERLGRRRAGRERAVHSDLGEHRALHELRRRLRDKRYQFRYRLADLLRVQTVRLIAILICWSIDSCLLSLPFANKLLPSNSETSSSLKYSGFALYLSLGLGIIMLTIYHIFRRLITFYLLFIKIHFPSIVRHFLSI